MKSNLCPYCFQPTNGYGPCPHCGHFPGEPRYGAQQLPVGTILDGKYQLGMILGQGGFGITYLAYDLTLRMRVAVKEYFPLGLVSRQGQTVTFTGGNAQPFFQKGVEAFYREAQLLARFQTYPNIVHISSFFRQNGTAYFVMEYVEGESLSDYIEHRGGKLSYEETIQLLSPILDALADVHNAGILHRDIAPDNICLAKDGQIKLLDFGAAKNELSLHTHSSAAILKPGYAPMEQYTAGNNQGPCTDIYAMGAVIYRCLTGSVPPDAPDRIIGQPLLSFKEANVSAPAGAEAAINKALALDIQNRWQSITDFKNALIDPSIVKKTKTQKQKQEKSQNTKQKEQKKWLIPASIIAALILIAGVFFSQVILPWERIYREGTSLISEGKYEDAIVKLSEIPSYRDSQRQIRRAKSLLAEEYLALDDYDNAMILFTELSGADYASELISQRKKEYEQLLQATREPASDENELQEQLSKTNIGDNVTTENMIYFGRYEQDNIIDNGSEPIEWRVLDIENGRALLISRYGLDVRPYNDGDEDVTWESSNIRQWLNETFYEQAFSPSEKERIQSVEQNNIKNYVTNFEGNAADRIFLLSIDEANHLFSSDIERECKATDYAKSKGAYINSSNGNARWWLRSPGYRHDFAVYVHEFGFIIGNGYDVRCPSNIVRPVFWLNLSENNVTDPGANIPTETPVYISATNTPIIIQTADNMAKGRFQNQKPADGTNFASGEAFDLTWTVENTGNTIWDSNYKLIYDGGYNFTTNKITEKLTGVTIWPNGAAGLTLPCVAPAEKGTYYMKWHVTDENGNTVLSPLTITINVQEWKYRIIVNYDKDDTTTDLSNVKKYQTWYSHLLISGSQQGENLIFEYKSHWPGGYIFNSTIGGNFVSENHAYTYQNYNGEAGNTTVEFYDSSGTTLLAQKTVYVGD